MGHNLYSGCHKCKLRVMHFRTEENVTILDFYESHSDCVKENLDNVVTIMDNNGNEPDWMSEGDGAYRDLILK